MLIVEALVLTIPLLGAAPLLYARLTRPEAILAHPARRAILAEVRRSPGATIAGIGRASALRRSAVRHHVATLQRAGFLRMTCGPVRRIYLVGEPVACHAEAADLSAQERALRLIADSGAAGLPRRAFHETLHDVPRRTRNHALLVLKRRHLIAEHCGLLWTREHTPRM